MVPCTATPQAPEDLLAQPWLDHLAASDQHHGRVNEARNIALRFLSTRLANLGLKTVQLRRGGPKATAKADELALLEDFHTAVAETATGTHPVYSDLSP